MATKRKPSKSVKSKKITSSTGATKVTRITASGDNAKSTPEVTATTKVTAIDTAPKKVSKKADKVEKTAKVKKTSTRRTPWRATGEYFAGAWYELRQVRWPNRKSTWKMTGALLLFTGFFIVVVLLLDTAFQSLFNVLLK